MWREGLSEDLYGWECTRDIAERIGIPTTTTREQLENLHILKLINRRLEEANRYDWQVSLYGVELIRASGIFEIESEDEDEVPF